MPKRHQGKRDQAARRRLAVIVAAGEAKCWRCGLPIAPDQEWDAGHIVDLANGGAPDGLRAPEHRLKRDCPAGGNRSNGALLGQALRRGEILASRRRARRLAEWLDTPNHNN